MQNDSNPYVPDATGVKHVADYISDLLNRHDWPGMPARSFVDKWGGGLQGQLEADQVAYNIAMMGCYGNAGEDSSGGDGWIEGLEPTSTYLMPYKADYLYSNYPAFTTYWPGRQMYAGKLSAKAIVPYFPRPLLNEISIKVIPEDTMVPGEYQTIPISADP